MRMKTLLLLLVLAGATFVSAPVPPSVQAQTVPTSESCPAETSTSTVRVEGLLSTHLASARERFGFGGADPSRLRLLTDSADAQTCQRLARVVRPKLRQPLVLTFYAAGPFYLVPTSWPPPPPGQLRFGHSGSVIYVLDEQFNLVATISG